MLFNFSFILSLKNSGRIFMEFSWERNNFFRFNWVTFRKLIDFNTFCFVLLVLAKYYCIEIILKHQLEELTINLISKI